ncbi:MAG: DNA polymerase IV [bacterium]|nr:DNA polymerase IV [bacterium]
MRKIIHIDMDAFYASVEQRDNPELKGKPVIVGGNPNSRGVVAACSYEARKFGIHSAMASSRAYQLCPKAVFVRPRFEAYKEVSQQIREIFHEYTDLVEPLSLDEAFLDVSENKMNMASATQIAEEIRKKIFERTELTASAGVSFNKFLAKVASDFNKPNGITVIIPEKADAFIDSLPIGKFFGVGKVTEKKMVEMGITRGKDIKALSKERLMAIFGKQGAYYYAISHGLDNRPVEPNRIRKSIGKETTLKEDIVDMDRMTDILETIACKIEDLLEKSETKGYTITLKVKYFDFQRITRSITLAEPVFEASVIVTHVKELLEKTEAGSKKIRLLGITISNFEGEEEEPGEDIQLRFPF